MMEGQWHGFSIKVGSKLCFDDTERESALMIFVSGGKLGISYQNIVFLCLFGWKCITTIISSSRH